MVTFPNTAQHRFDIGRYRKIRTRVNAGGYWEVWYADADDGYQTKKESLKTKDPREAQAVFDNWCADARTETVAAAAGTGKPPTVEKLCCDWLDAVRAEGKDRTGRFVLTAPRRELGHYTADQIDRKILRDYATKRGRKPSTVRRELSALRTVLRWAARERQIDRDDVPMFEGVIPAEGPPRDKFLDPTQEVWFWAEAQRYADPNRWTTRLERDSAYKVMLFAAIGLDTAARRGAILDLEWPRVDLQAGTIDFMKPGRRTTKKRRVRGLPISKRLMPVLKEAWLRAPKDAAGQATGKVVDCRHIQKTFKRFTTEIGAPWITPHVLRHTWGSLRAMEGLPLYDIAKGMGDTVATVERNYLHLTPDHLRKAFKA